MLAALALPLLAASSYAASVCNGDAALCERRYSNVTFIGAHNSYGDGQSIADNQNKDVTAQLNDGIRALQVQAHNNNGTIHLCHTSCGLLDAGPMQEYLSEVATWMNANPNEVVSMVIVNADNLPPTQFASAFEAAGLDKKAYSPAAATITVTEWPTLGSLIDAGTTLVAFMASSADFTSVPWLIQEFGNVFEDAYDVTEQSFNCTVDRINGSPNSQMYLINHFLDVSTLGGTILYPNKDKLNETNAATGSGSIGAHVDNCLALYGRSPNIILLDYYDSEGNAPFDVAAQLNGVAAPTATVTPWTQTASSTATSTTAAGSNTGISADISSTPFKGDASSAGPVGSILAAALALALAI